MGTQPDQVFCLSMCFWVMPPCLSIGPYGLPPKPVKPDQNSGRTDSRNPGTEEGGRTMWGSDECREIGKKLQGFCVVGFC